MTTTTAILANIETVSIRLDSDSEDMVDHQRLAEELTKVFPTAEVEVSANDMPETRLDARGEIDGEDLRIIGRGRSYDVLGGVDAPSGIAEEIDALIERAWDRACA